MNRTKLRLALGLPGPAMDWKSIRYFNNQYWDLRPDEDDPGSEKPPLTRPPVESSELFYQPTIDYLLSFKPNLESVRFMDLQRTNGSGLVSWSERSVPNSYQGDKKRGGLCLEWCLALADKLDCVPWLHVPHRADSEYQDNFLAMLGDWGKTFYLEFSNELWNVHPAFPQAHYSLSIGESYSQFKDKKAKGSAVLQSGLAVKAKNALGDQVKTVLAGWHAGVNYNKRLVEYLGNDVEYFDVFATAPYFGSKVFKSKPEDMAEILERTKASLVSTKNMVAQNKALADSVGLESVTYEGGQHLVDKYNDAKGKKLNRHIEICANPRMDDIVYSYLSDYYEINPTGMFNWFTSGPQKWNENGSWSLVQKYNQPTPLLTGLRRFYGLSSIWS